MNFSKYAAFFGPKMDIYKESVIHRKQADIEIYIVEKGDIVPSAKDQLQGRIAANKSHPGFHLIKQYTAEISGISGKVLQYSDSGQYNDYSGQVTFSFSTSFRGIYFENHGYIWSITCYYPVEMSKEAQADFDHMLKTFKLLP